MAPENFIDSFTYVVSDANGGVTDTGTVSITVTPVNDNDPVANNDNITVSEGGTGYRARLCCCQRSGQ
ncbi:MAG: Ig-like domain-containing protein [Burkholderiaceae bacterium]